MRFTPPRNQPLRRTALSWATPQGEDLPRMKSFFFLILSKDTEYSDYSNIQSVPYSTMNNSRPQQEQKEK